VIQQVVGEGGGGAALELPGYLNRFRLEEICRDKEVRVQRVERGCDNL